MTIQLIEKFSGALAERASGVQGAVAARASGCQAAGAAIPLHHGRHLSATLWQPDVALTSEQSLPRREEFELLVAGGDTLKAKLAGRDPGPTRAALRLERPIEFSAWRHAEPIAGALALAFGADGTGGVRTRLGVVNAAGPEWTSSAGGRLDRYIALDLTLGRAEEGGPALDASGRLLGITTFGPRGRVLVIPAATIARVVPALIRDGRIARGWLGVGLAPVAVPDALQAQAGQTSGAMVMSLVGDGPAAKAGIVAGDIVLSVNSTPARRLRDIAAALGSESVGRTAELRVIPGGGPRSGPGQ